MHFVVFCWRVVIESSARKEVGCFDSDGYAERGKIVFFLRDWEVVGT